jgi:uncharacterized protein
VSGSPRARRPHGTRSRRHDDREQDATRPEHAAHVGEEWGRVVHALKGRDAQRVVERGIGERQPLVQVGLDEVGGRRLRTRPRQHCRREVKADDGEAALCERARVGPGAAPEIEDPCAGGRVRGEPFDPLLASETVELVAPRARVDVPEQPLEPHPAPAPASDHSTQGDGHVSTHKRIVEKYIEGFRRSDHAQILSCLTDEVLWALHGYKPLQGKDAFDAEIENEGFEGSPAITVDRLIEEGDNVVATGGGTVAEKGGKRREFVFCEVFSFTGDAVSRLDTYHVWLT